MEIAEAQQELLARLNNPERPRSRWEEMVEAKPGHSEWYIQRFAKMAAAGADLEGEARLVNALVPPHAKILDAGCGPGRHANYLALLGHQVTGVDIDAKLIARAENDWQENIRQLPGNRKQSLAGVDLLANPDPTPGLVAPKFLQGDITTISPEVCPDAPYDLVMCAGNVLTFLKPGTQKHALAAFASILKPGGRAVIGFGAGRGYEFSEFFADAIAVGLRVQQCFATWDLQPFMHKSEESQTGSDFLVAVLTRG